MKVEKIKLECKICKKHFERWPSQLKAKGSGQYCGVKCKGIGGRVPITRCLICKNAITPGASYCSFHRGNNPELQKVYASNRNKPAWNKGKKNPAARNNPQTFKKGFIPWNKGLKSGDHPGIRSGEKINTWKGGITPINFYLRKTLRYKEWRKAVFERDNYRCVLCGDHTYSGRGAALVLNADHIKPWSLFPELRFEISNGRTLCLECHRKTETYGRGSHIK